MPLKLFRSKLLPIGVDLGCTRIKMAQLRTVEPDSLELVAADCIEVPSDLAGQFAAQMDFMAGEIRRSLKANRFQGRRCILSLPARHTFLQHVRLPRANKAQIDRLLRAELAGKLPCGVEEAVISYVLAGEVPGESEGRQEMIVAAAPRETLEAYLEMAGKAGLDVVGINIESCAVVQCFARLFRRAGDEARAILFLDLGAQSTQVLLTHGEKLVFARNLDRGDSQFDQALAAGLKISPQQAHSMRRDLQKSTADNPAQDEVYHHLEGPLDSLAAEIMQCIRYHDAVFRNQAVERLVLVGGQACDKRLCQALAERLNLPAQIGDPLLRVRRVDGAGLHIGLDRREPQPQWAVAVGLSLGAA